MEYYKNGLIFNKQSASWISNVGPEVKIRDNFQNQKSKCEAFGVKIRFLTPLIAEFVSGVSLQKRKKTLRNKFIYRYH